jgi:hypothetical protein
MIFGARTELTSQGRSFCPIRIAYCAMLPAGNEGEAG